MNFISIFFLLLFISFTIQNHVQDGEKKKKIKNTLFSNQTTIFFFFFKNVQATKHVTTVLIMTNVVGVNQIVNAWHPIAQLNVALL